MRGRVIDSSMTKFKARIESIKGGGHYVVVPDAAAKKAKLEYRMRVRGTVAGTTYRSSLMKYSGVYHLGVHKATLAAAGVKAGDTVSIAIEADREPLPHDTVPEILAAALDKNRAAKAAFAKLAPSHRREHVRYVSEAKKAETQAARVEKTIAALLAR
jgi:hypothetical protein